MIVVHASAAVAALLNSGPARDALTRERLHVPYLIDTEIASALRRRASAAELHEDLAWRALDTWRRLGMIRYPVVDLLNRVWELRHNVSAYDASYVALAEALGCPLLTGDSRLARATGITCPITVVPR